MTKKKRSPTLGRVVKEWRNARSAYQKDFAAKHILTYEDGTEAKPGDSYEGMTLVTICPPLHRGSTGRVIVDENGQQCSYFPCVIGASWTAR